MRKALLIFDQSIDIAALSKRLNLSAIERLEIFPLTSEHALTAKVENIIRSKNNGGIEISLLESARLIDEQVDVLRGKISKWSAELSQHQIDGRSIKQWFLLPGGEVSTWWFSLLSEKNPLKTDAFFNIARLEVIDSIISLHNFDLSISSIAPGEFFLAVEEVCKRHKLKLLFLSGRRRISLSGLIKLYLDKKSIFSCVLKTLLCLRVSIFRAILAKSIMGPVKNRLKEIDNSVLFVSYFPYIDKQSAQEGRLKNKYALALQEKLRQMEKKITWIWMYSFRDGYSFPGAARLAAKFAKNGEVNFFLDEFISARILVRSLLLWLGQIKTFRALSRKIPEHILYENLSIPEGAILIRNLMLDSFARWRGLEGILYFQLYKAVFSRFSRASHCIYYSEMHAWEKALNAARRLNAPAVTTIAFQHAVVSRNYFHYFSYPSETAQGPDSSLLPSPDILACNGDISLKLMKECGYPNIRKVEDVRHLYLTSRLNNLCPSPRREKIVLISGSINRKETRALISLFYHAFPKPHGFKVWLKSHPSLPLEGILEELGIDDKSEYAVKYEPVSQLLKTASIVLAGGSAVALEALASGAKLILPVFADCMFLNPIAGFDRFYTKIYNPAQLRKVVEETMRSGREESRDMREIADFISSYWCLDESLDRWAQVLKERQDADTRCQAVA